MKTIYKYQLPTIHTSIELPEEYKILAAQVQKGIACVWVMVDTEKSFDIPVEFLIYPTGVSINRNNINYIGTIQEEDGNIVGHVFYTA